MCRYYAGLAQNRYFDDPAFVKYLDYLQYWRRPEYSKLIQWVLTHARCMWHRALNCGA